MELSTAPEDNKIRVINLPTFSVDASYFRDTIKAILHTIYFHRILGPISPIDVEIEALNFTYARCNEKKTEQIIERKIEEMFQNFKKSPTRAQTIEILFYQKAMIERWFRQSETLEPWEKWVVGVKLLPPSPDPDAYRKSLADELETHLSKIMKKSATQFPLTRPTDLIPYPYSITLPSVQSSILFTFFNSEAIIS